ncbi:hypothetical protein MTO96_007660 [Rhipicephalus appendiculatus]
MATVIESYNVKVCRTFRTCGQAGHLGDCKEYVTTQTSVTFDSRADTPYCILVTARTRCGMDEISSRPAVAQLRTPIFVPPDVTNLHVVTVGADFFTAAWERPKVSFDYYWIEVTGAKSSRTAITQGPVGSCVRGTIIRPDQTQVTCSQLPPCVKVGFKVQTHISKAPIRTSPGVTLKDIYIPGKVGVRNLTVSSVGDDNFTLTWQKLEGCVDHYTVNVIDNSDGSSGSASNGIVSCNKGAVITSSQTSVTCDQPVTCANATISVKPHVRGLADSALNGQTLSGVYLPGKTPPPVTDLYLWAITNRYFEINYRTPKECYTEFNHYISPYYSRGKASSSPLHSRQIRSQCRAARTPPAVLLVGAAYYGSRILVNWLALWAYPWCDHPTKCFDYVRELDASLDRSVDPCENLYEHVCAHWSRRYAAFGNNLHLLQGRTTSFLLHELERPAPQHQSKAVRQVVSGYQACRKAFSERREDVQVLFDIFSKFNVTWPALRLPENFDVIEYLLGMSLDYNLATPVLLRLEPYLRTDKRYALAMNIRPAGPHYSFDPGKDSRLHAAGGAGYQWQHRVQVGHLPQHKSVRKDEEVLTIKNTGIVLNEMLRSSKRSHYVDLVLFSGWNIITTTNFGMSSSMLSCISGKSSFWNSFPGSGALPTSCE